MRLSFRQRFLSWFDSYDIYDEAGETVYTVDGKLSWGHRLEIHDRAGRYLGRVQEELFTLLPRFVIYLGEDRAGEIQQELTFLRPRFTLSCNGWQVEGDWLEWNYQVVDAGGRQVMTASKELLHLTDVYVLDIADPADALMCLMVVLAIDAAKCDG